MALFVFLLLLGASGCQSCDPLDGAAPGQKASKRFFEEWNRSDWNSIVRGFDPRLTDQQSPEQAKADLADRHSQLGNEVSTTETRGESHVFGSSVEYWSTWDTKFEHGSGQVSLMWRIDKGKTTLKSWHINSDATNS